MKAQVSVEMMTAFVVLLLFFVFILSYVGQGDIQRNIAAKNNELKIQCEKIAAQLNTAYAFGDQTQTKILNDFNVFINSKLVFVNKDENAIKGTSCTHTSVIQSSYSSSTVLNVKNQQGVLVFG